MLIAILGMSRSEEKTPEMIVLRNMMIKIDYYIESAPYGFLFTSRKILETNE